MQRFWLIVFACLPMAVVEAHAWGSEGHEIVCEIAFEELRGTPAHARLKQIVRADSLHKRFSDACNWADRVRPRRKTDHYLNVPRRFAEIRTPRCPGDVACLLSAIPDDFRALRHGSVESQVEALRFLGHFVGDIHQPLHVAYEDDRGGSDILERGPCFDEWNGERTEDISLHAVWDRCILVRRIGRNTREVAASLRKSITPGDRVHWVEGLDDDVPAAVMQWADESYQISRSESVGYCFREAAECRYAPGASQQSDAPAPRFVEVDESYLDDHTEIVAMRLRQAGVRLAALLKLSLGE